MFLATASVKLVLAIHLWLCILFFSSVILVSLMTGKVLFLYLLRCIFNIYIYPVSATKNSVRQVCMKGNIVEGSTYMRMER